MEREDFDAAVEQFLHAFLLEPHFKTLELLGTCCQRLGRLHEAVLYLAAAAGLGNGQFRARFLLAEVLASLGDIDGAVNKLEEAIELNPNFRRARELLKRIRAEDGGGEAPG
jgi:tetratricopeptide (TPR) repeat protein